MKKYKGFSLVEFGIVVAIIFIIGAVMGRLLTFNLPNYQHMIEANRIIMEGNLIRKNVENDILSAQKVSQGSGEVILEITKQNKKITYTKVDSKLFRSESYKSTENKMLLSENVAAVNFENNDKYYIFSAQLKDLTSPTPGKKTGQDQIYLKIFKR